MERPKPAYGQACTQCYKAKCRCVRTTNGGNCERCLRLRKRCQPSESLRRRNAQAAEESDARIARLEDKMDGLLSAMQSFVGSGAVPPIHGHGVSQPFPFNTSSSNATGVGFGEGPTTADSSATVSPTSNPVLQYPNYPSPALSSQEDEQIEYFRSRMLPCFPFIYFTPNMTSRYLREHRPCLLQAIHTITTFSTQERLVQIDHLKRLLFTSSLIKVESNIDLLLGVLTYLAWSTDPFLGRADLVSRLMMLAISLVYDLRLFKPSSPDVQIMMTITQGRDENSHEPNDETSNALLERQRAVLACFVLSSNISSHLGRQDALRWTPQMEEGLRVLTLTESCPTDALFVSQVRLQLLKQRADHVRQQDETDITGINHGASAPRLLYVKSLRRQLHELRASFPSDLQIDILNTHAQYVELYINQLAYSISRDYFALKSPGRRGDSDTMLGFQRIECLWQSVENIKAWLDLFYNMPCSKLIGQPFHFWSQMILSITLLKYLSTLQDPEWDCQAVRNTVDLISTMDCMLEKLNLPSKEPELQCNDHLLTYLSKLLTKCREWAEARWNTITQIQDVESVTGTTSQAHQIPDLDQIVWMQSMDLGDDEWFDSVLSIPTFS
ncbi:C6 transcription factor [Aspergillus sclerotioniger CBS 115572]|uniref:C6 transcription factor n=1 Tax=Aspergillus sclerotioniger CBS 115572 TaxID=1450535 RepID=A0A317X213_9EURO|nr:C6 transcription factor [Aspergillus sclerotioniger CBS 115572]PWY91642.1 C6 transcription factor [Aspergillus sclerotioniger CBS 115572]